MISQDRDYEDVLRDALRAAAAAVEPASDGLVRIRHRVHSHRSARSMVAGAVDWLQMYRVRLSVWLESFRWELSQHGIGRPPTGPRHGGRRPARRTAGRLGPAAAWLKPAFAVVAVVAVVVIGVVTLNRVQQAVITPANSVTSPGRQHVRAPASALAHPGLWSQPMGVTTNPPATSKKKGQVSVLPAVACTPVPVSSGSPAPATITPTSPAPTPAGTPTATPSATPSPTVSPSGTPTTGTGGTTATGAGNTAANAGNSLASAAPSSTAQAANSTANAAGSSTAKATATAMFSGSTPGVSCGGATSTPSPKTTASS